ncbi:MAG: hypothetical protein ABI589_10400 [Burkholderiales bacterium]
MNAKKGTKKTTKKAPHEVLAPLEGIAISGCLEMLGIVVEIFLGMSPRSSADLRRKAYAGVWAL